MAKMQPAVKTITLATASVDATSTGIFYVDLSQIASIVNRRFYRQGLNWGVAGFKVNHQGSTSGAVMALKLQETWITSNAWEKAFRHWRKQQDEALDEAGLESVKSKFNDFKIFMDDNHFASFVSNGYDLNATNEIPPGYLTGEWEASQIVIPNDQGVAGDENEYFLKMYGGDNIGNNTAKGIVQGYALSRAYPQSPDPSTPRYDVANSWLSQMQDLGEIQSEVVSNAIIRNDELPYDQENYPGQGVAGSPDYNAGACAIHDKQIISATSIGGTTYLKGGNFPCGLIQFQVHNSGLEALVFDIQIDLMPGDHRGYLAESMLEM